MQNYTTNIQKVSKPLYLMSCTNPNLSELQSSSLLNPLDRLSLRVPGRTVQDLFKQWTYSDSLDPKRVCDTIIIGNIGPTSDTGILILGQSGSQEVGSSLSSPLNRWRTDVNRLVSDVFVSPPDYFQSISMSEKLLQQNSHH